jgi:hypothetical protein
VHIIFWLENLNVKVHSEYIGVDEKLKLKWILGKLCTGFIWIRIGPVADCFEQRNEPSGSIKGREFLE